MEFWLRLLGMCAAVSLIAYMFDCEEKCKDCRSDTLTVELESLRQEIVALKRAQLSPR